MTRSDFGRHLAKLLFACVLAPPALAQNVINQDTTIRDALCVGFSCLDTEFYNNGDNMRLKSNSTRIYFDDTSTPTFPGNDWRIVTNSNLSVENGGESFFAIEDASASNIIFRLDAGAPANGLVLDAEGELGLGTLLPQHEIHIMSDSYPTIRLEQIATSSLGARIWDIRASDVDFAISDPAFGSLGIFRIDAGAQNSSLYIDSQSRVGVGTNVPQERLHVLTTAINDDAFVLIDAAGADADAAFRLRQNGVTPTTWEFRNQQDSGRLNVGIAGGNTPFKIDNAANNNLMLLGRNGRPDEVHITGKLVVNNTQLNVPDYVFSDGYALRPLAEVQAFIAAHSHLPDVPSEAEIKADGVNMTAMQMALLKKVEELTLYTLEQEAKLARMAELEDRIARLETLLD